MAKIEDAIKIIEQTLTDNIYRFIVNGEPIKDYNKKRMECYTY